MSAETNHTTEPAVSSYPPRKVLITGGHELGGVGSVATALTQGFDALGISVELIPPSAILSRWRDLRDIAVLKILSTGAVFAVPLAKRAICIAHGIPCADVQGWARLAGIVASYKLANSTGARVVAVSDYTAVHLQTVFNVRIDAVIRNPLKAIFLEPFEPSSQQRPYITYVGRLHPAKNIQHLLPAICDLLEENRELRACIIGDGELRGALEESTRNNPRVEFKGAPDDSALRMWLRKTKVLVSGNQTEGLGVTYLEALSQGCVVAMPASGGGLELGLEWIGSAIHLLPLSLDRSSVLEVLRRAVSSRRSWPSFSAYHPEAVAAAYLAVDSTQQPGSLRTVPRRTIRAVR